MDTWHNQGTYDGDINTIDASAALGINHGRSQQVDWRKRYRFWFRTIATVIIFAFILYDITWAQGGASIWPSSNSEKLGQSPSGTVPNFSHKPQVSKIEIPAGLAATQDAYSNGNNEVIINIQDAHASLSAQESIVQLLDTLSNNYDLNVVALEGGEGPLDTAFLRSLPDAEVRGITARHLMKRGLMSAGEFFSVMSDKNIKLYGIEDDRLYQANLGSFRQVAAKRSECVRETKNLANILKLLEPEVYSKDLLEFNEKSEAHRDRRLSFAAYWEFVSEFASERGIKVASFDNLSKLLKTAELEKEINFSRANYERRRLIDDLTRALPKDEVERLILNSLAFKKGELSKSEFHSYLVGLAGKTGMDPAPYPNLICFTSYITIYESIDIFDVFAELDSLEEAIREKIFTNDDERTLSGISRAALMLEKLFEVSITSSDYGFFSQKSRYLDKALISSFIAENSSKYTISADDPCDLDPSTKAQGRALSLAEGLDVIFSNMEEAIRFYDTAQKRNDAMLANTVNAMRKNGEHIAALVTGGYHSQGLSALMKEKGLSYLVIMPRFEAGKERPYIAILTNKRQPYEELLDSGEYTIAVPPYFRAGDPRELMDTPAFCAVAAGYDKGVAAEEFVRDWLRSFTRMYHENPDTINRWLDEGKRPVTPAQFAGFLGFDEPVIRIDTFGRVESVTVTRPADSHAGFTAEAIESDDGARQIAVTHTGADGSMTRVVFEKDEAASGGYRVVDTNPAAQTKPVARRTGKRPKDIRGRIHPLVLIFTSVISAALYLYNNGGMSAEAVAADPLFIKIAIGAGALFLVWYMIFPRDFRIFKDLYERQVDAARQTVSLVGDINTGRIRQKDVARMHSRIMLTIDSLVGIIVNCKDSYTAHDARWLLRRLNNRRHTGGQVYRELRARLRDSNPLVRKNANFVMNQLGWSTVGLPVWALAIIGVIVYLLLSGHAAEALQSIGLGAAGLMTVYFRMGQGENAYTNETLMELLNREFPEAAIDKEVFVEAFLDQIPYGVAKDRQYTEFLLKTSYAKALDVIKDSDKLHFTFCKSPGLKTSQIIVALDDKLRGLNEFVYSTFAKEGIDVRDSLDLRFDIGSDTDKARISIMAINVSETGMGLRPQTVENITVAFEGYEVAPVTEYKGTSSFSDTLLKGYAAYYDAGTEVDIAAIISNIIPPEAQLDPVKARTVIDKDIADLHRIMNEIESNNILKSLVPPIRDRIIRTIGTYADAVVRKMVEGLDVPYKRIIKPPSAILLHQRLDGQIKRLERMKNRRAHGGGYANLTFTIDALKIISETIVEKAFYTERLISPDAEPDEINAAVKRERDRFLKVIKNVRKETAATFDGSTQESAAGQEVTLAVESYIGLLERRVFSKIRETLLPASAIIAEPAAENDRMLTGLPKNPSEHDIKRFETPLAIRTCLQKIAAGLKGAEMAVKVFNPIPTGEKHILFVKGYLLASDVENLVNNMNVACFVTAEAGPTTHWVLAAKNLGIPVFFVTRDAANGRSPEEEFLSMSDIIGRKVSVGDEMIIDAGTGSLTANPNTRMLADYNEKAVSLAALKEYYDRRKQSSAATIDGDTIEIFANVEDARTVRKAAKNGASGTGLIRTEMCIEQNLGCLHDFMENTGSSLARKELKTYLRKMAAERIISSRGRKLRFRVPDITPEAGKNMGGLDRYGAFGLRFFELPAGRELLNLFLEAIFEATAILKAENVEVMFPNVETEKDLDNIFDNWIPAAKRSTESAVRRFMEERNKPQDEIEDSVRIMLSMKIGSMLESVAGFNNAETIAGRSDFLSLGLNDGTQDIFNTSPFARELQGRFNISSLRQTIRATHLFSELQPEVLGATRDVCKAVAAVEKETGRKIPITVCGDIASRPEFMLFIIYLRKVLGVDVSPSVPFMVIPRLKELARNVSYEGLIPIFEQPGQDVDARAKEKVFEVEGRARNKPEVRIRIDELLRSAAPVVPEAADSVILKRTPKKAERAIPGGPAARKTITLEVIGFSGAHLRPKGVILKFLKENKDAGFDIFRIARIDIKDGVETAELSIDDVQDMNIGSLQMVFTSLPLDRGDRLDIDVGGPPGLIDKFITKLNETEDAITGGGVERVFRVKVTDRPGSEGAEPATVRAARRLLGPFGWLYNRFTAPWPEEYFKVGLPLAAGSPALGIVVGIIFFVTHVLNKEAPPEAEGKNIFAKLYLTARSMSFRDIRLFLTAPFAATIAGLYFIYFGDPQTALQNSIYFHFFLNIAVTLMNFVYRAYQVAAKGALETSPFLSAAAIPAIQQALDIIHANRDRFNASSKRYAALGRVYDSLKSRSINISKASIAKGVKFIVRGLIRSAVRDVMKGRSDEEIAKKADDIFAIIDFNIGAAKPAAARPMSLEEIALQVMEEEEDVPQARGEKPAVPKTPGVKPTEAPIPPSKNVSPIINKELIAQLNVYYGENGANMEDSWRLFDDRLDDAFGHDDTAGQIELMEELLNAFVIMYFGMYKGTGASEQMAEAIAKNTTESLADALNRYANLHKADPQHNFARKMRIYKAVKSMRAQGIHEIARRLEPCKKLASILNDKSEGRLETMFLRDGAGYGIGGKIMPLILASLVLPLAMGAGWPDEAPVQMLRDYIYYASGALPYVILGTLTAATVAFNIVMAQRTADSARDFLANLFKLSIIPVLTIAASFKFGDLYLWFLTPASLGCILGIPAGKLIGTSIIGAIALGGGSYSQQAVTGKAIDWRKAGRWSLVGAGLLGLFTYGLVFTPLFFLASRTVCPELSFMALDLMLYAPLIFIPLEMIANKYFVSKEEVTGGLREHAKLWWKIVRLNFLWFGPVLPIGIALWPDKIALVDANAAIIWGGFLVVMLKRLEAPADKLRPLIVIGIPGNFSADERSRIESAVKRAGARIPERLDLVYFNDLGSDKENMRYLSGVSLKLGAAMELPIRRDITTDELIDEMDRGMLDQISGSLFGLINTDIASLDQSRNKLAGMDANNKARIAGRLAKALPPVAAEGVTTLSLYSMNLRARNIHRNYAVSHPYDAAFADKDQNGSLKIAVVHSAAEIKPLAEAHAGKAGTLKIALVPTKEELDKGLTIEDILEHEDIGEDVLKPADILMVTRPMTLTEMRDEFESAFRRENGNGIPNKIAIADLTDPDRNAADLPQGVIFLEYDGVAGPHVYYALCEAVVKPEDQEHMTIERMPKGWFRIIQKVDIEQLRREIEQYEKILIAA